MFALEIDLELSTDELLKYYRGQARTVRARATTGQSVQFPVSVLQRHVTMSGIRGRFRLVFDQHHKFVRLDPVPV